MSYGRYAATAAFMIVVIAAGVLHGNATFRWAEKPKLDEYATRIQAVPKTFDNWTSKELPPFLDDLRAHGIESYVYRVYENLASTESYRVLLVVGRGGPISAHTPDVCNRGAGYTAIGDPRRSDIAGTDVLGNSDGRMFQMMKLNFKPPATRAVDTYEQDFRWSWLVPGKTFRAPEVQPRIEFGPEPVLYKLYVMYERPTGQGPATTATGAAVGATTPSVASAATHDPTKFLQAFLPRAEAALNGTPKP